MKVTKQSEYDVNQYQFLYSWIRKLYLKKSKIGEVISKKIKEINERRASYLIDNIDYKLPVFNFGSLDLKNFIRKEVSNDPLLIELNKITMKYTTLKDDQLYEKNTILLFSHREFSSYFKDLYLRIFESRDLHLISKEMNCETHYNVYMDIIKDYKDQRDGQNMLKELFELNLNDFKLYFELQALIDNNLDFKSYTLIFSFYKLAKFEMERRKYLLESILFSLKKVKSKKKTFEMLSYYEKIPLDQNFNYIFEIFTSYFNFYL